MLTHLLHDMDVFNFMDVFITINIYFNDSILVKDTLCLISAGTQCGHSRHDSTELELDFAVAIDDTSDQCS